MISPLILLHIAKISLVFSLLYLVYLLVFKRSTHFQINRFYLLLAIPFSVLVSLLGSVEHTDPTTFLLELPTMEIAYQQSTETSLSNVEWTGVIYTIITTLFVFVLLFNLLKTWYQINQIKKGALKDYQPFSFFSLVFIPDSIDEENLEYIQLHEEVHVQQLHSLDVIIFELFKAVMWWNPLVWMATKTVKANHEYIADEIASQKTNDNYTTVLVAQLLGVNCSALANNFSYEPFIKSRIKMMKTKKSTKKSIWKYAIVIPVMLFAFIFTGNITLLGQTDATQNTEEKVFEKVDKEPEYPGGMQAMMQFIGSNVVYPADAKEAEVSGTAYVSFIIDEKGNVTEPKVLRSVFPSIDAEAVRVVKMMPKWTPGEYQKKAVKVKYTLPIRFALQ